jgi:hypothetical protein
LKILGGKFSEVSLERLMRFLTAPGYHIEIGAGKANKVGAVPPREEQDSGLAPLRRRSALCAAANPRPRDRAKSYSGAPRSMKMGTTASPWRYDRMAKSAIWRADALQGTQRTYDK